MFLTKTLFFLVCCSLSLYAGTINIVAITQDFASIAKSVGGRHVVVESLVYGSKNLHAIEAKPSMVLKARKADLFIRLGMQQDSWVDSLIHVASNKRIFTDAIGYMDASIGIEKLEVPEHDLDGSHGDVHIEGNPHYWLNPLNGKVIANNIKLKLQSIQPENYDEFEANYKRFCQEIDDKFIVWSQRLSGIKSKKIITYHKVWSYFFDAFSLHSLGQLEPLPGIPPSAKHLLDLEKKVKQSSDKVVVISSFYYPRKVADSFAKKVDGTSIVLPTNVGTGTIHSYTDLFEYITGKLK